MADFLPRRDLDLRLWSDNFARAIAADPAGYGLTGEQAAGYAEVQSAYAVALGRATDRSTRGLLTVRRKDEARAALVGRTRELARIVRAWPGITAVKKIELGLMPPGRGEADVTVNTAVGSAGSAGTGPGAGRGLPAVGPTVRVWSPNREVRVEVWSLKTGRRRPSGAVGAAVYYALGETPPTRIDEWALAGNCTRPDLRFTLPAEATPPGTPVHLVARWLDRRLQPGPAGPPTATRIGFEPLLHAA